MFTFWDQPAPGIVYLRGKSHAIDEYLRLHAEDLKTAQYNGDSTYYYVRVLYSMESEKLRVAQVSIYLRPDEWWTLYDASSRANPLSLPLLKPVLISVQQYEKHLVLRRLTKAGPDALPRRKATAV